jgi:hypothetical protein
MKAGASSTTTKSQHEGWSIINISTRLRVFNMRLESQHEASYTISSTQSWTHNTRLAHHHNTRLAHHYITRLANHHNTRLTCHQHEAGITTIKLAHHHNN